MDRRTVIVVFVAAFSWIPGSDLSPRIGLCSAPDGSWYSCWLTPPPPILVLLLGGGGSFDERRGLHRTSEELAAATERVPAPSAKYGYDSSNGPAVWPLTYPQCGGTNQSPIDLNPGSMLPMDALEPLLWDNYWLPPANMTIANNGHTVEVTGSWESPRMQPSISDGPLSGEYMFASLHFHWGPEDHLGSEHTVNNLSFPMEMHAVHYKKDYGSFQEAIKHRDGVAVVAFFIDTGDRDNPALSYLMSPMQAVKKAHTTSTVTRTFPLAMLKHQFNTEYVTYFGSLTTPPCSEVVTWIISTKPLHMSYRQLSVFRALSGSGNMDERNFRPVQPLNHRLIFYFK